MAEGPTAESEPASWGTEEVPFPKGTKFRVPNRAGGECRETIQVEESNESNDLVALSPGFEFLAREIQGLIEVGKWKLVDDPPDGSSGGERQEDGA